MILFQESKSVPVAETFSPNQVKKILAKIGFNEDDVASWNESIEVPLGVSSTLYITRIAIISGLSFPYVNLYQELEGICMYGGKIPQCVQDKIHSISTKEILGGKGEVGDCIPEKVLAYTYNYRKDEQKLKVISQIRDKFGDTRKFLYRGINSHNMNATLVEGFMDRSSLRKEFGTGLYATPNIDYAIEYAGRNGTLIIFDWSNPDRNLNIKHLDDLEEWKSTVKGWICIDVDDKPGPPIHRADILEGFISSNYDSISACHDPIPSENIQVVGRTDSAINAFAERLFAVVYLKSEK